MRKHLLFGALAVFGMGMNSHSFAQDKHFSCGISEQLQKLYAQNPGLEADYYRLLQNSKQTFHTKSGDDTTIYRIPIVFHILHEYGSENISDLQVYDQMDILNNDYRKLNADTTDIVSVFDTIAGDARIEFVLPTIDPFGNCTNGIEHIYTHMSNFGDDYSKLNQWNRAKYLNVWVTNTIGSAGVAGYAYYPSATVGTFFFADGIIILNDYIGSIGTSNLNSSRALTHEIGHYLGLSHTWGSTNDPNVACGDDQVDDTPKTKGSDLVCNLNANTCVDGGVLDYWTFDVVDNVQNYMDYSYCSNMFTRDQINLMRTNLQQDVSFRNNLWSDTNLIATGADYLPGTPQLCAPVADFSMDDNMVCMGGNVLFTSASWNATIDDYSWSFPGGTPATSTNPSQSVTYSAPGWYDVTLTVSNASGSSTKTIANAVYISPDWTEHYGPAIENFNTTDNYWAVFNPENNHANFHRIATNGVDNSGCFMLNNYKDISEALPFTDDAFYYERLGYSKDYMVSPAYNLDNTTGITVSFDYAYGTKATTSADITEKLVVYSSNNCGETWIQRKVVTGASLLTVGYVGNEDFYPTANGEWKTASFAFTPGATETNTRFKFEFVASDFSSNFFLDNVNVSGTLGINDNTGFNSVSVSPNPVAAGSELAVEVTGSTKNMEINVTDLNGKVVSTTKVTDLNGTQTVNIPMNVAKGCYIVNAVQGTNKSTHRVVVY